MKTTGRLHVAPRFHIVLCVVFFFLSALFSQIYTLSHINGNNFNKADCQNAVYSVLVGECIEDFSYTFRAYFNNSGRRKPVCPPQYRKENSNLSFTAWDADGNRLLQNYVAPEARYCEIQTVTIECSGGNTSDVLRKEKVTVSCSVNRDLTANDCFRRAERLMQIAVQSYWTGLVPAVVFGILSLIFAVQSVRSVLRESRRRHPSEQWSEWVAPDLFLVCFLPALVFFIKRFPNDETQTQTLLSFIRYGSGAQRFLFAPLCLTGMFFILFLFALLFLFSVRHGGLANVISYKRFEKAAFTRRATVYLIIMQLAKLTSIGLFLSTHTRSVIFFLALEKAVTLPVLYRSFREIREITEQTAVYAQGDLSTPMNPSKYYASFAEHVDDIQSFTNRISVSADEYLRSSQFKAELITNLSHDIKTPLTSILNYAQLLNNPKLPESEKEQCLQVLNRHAQRMQKLLVDLTVVSDAQSGKVDVNLTDVNLCEAVSQAVAGFEERLKNRSLSLSVNIPDSPVIVTADPQLLWRVADNLLNNICKYAKEGTCVQITVLTRDKVAAVNFRNTSASAQNLSGEQLVERFVRGDSSRHTDGYGLGLSIARSLMGLQRGRLHIKTEDDLFTAQMLFRRIQ